MVQIVGFSRLLLDHSEVTIIISGAEFQSQGHTGGRISLVLDTGSLLSYISRLLLENKINQSTRYDENKRDNFKHKVIIETYLAPSVNFFTVRLFS